MFAARAEPVEFPFNEDQPSMKSQPSQSNKTAKVASAPAWQSMSRKERREWIRKMQAEDLSLEVIHPHAAGIDIGNELHYVAVPPDGMAKRCGGLDVPRQN